MATITATCPRCGNVQLGSPDVKLLLCRSNPVLSSYEFRCPSCYDRIKKHANPFVVQLLLEGGVHPHVWDHPTTESQVEIERKPENLRPLTEHEIFDFRLDLGLNDNLADVAFNEERS